MLDKKRKTVLKLKTTDLKIKGKKKALMRFF